jgi:hypothetical protein
MGDGDGALSDALKCRILRPKWAKACFRQAAAHMLLKVLLACQCVSYLILILFIVWSRSLICSATQGI